MFYRGAVLILGIVFISIGCTKSSAQVAPRPELERGDPDLAGVAAETLILTPAQAKLIEDQLNTESRGPKVDRPKVALRTVEEAKSQIGTNRKDHKVRVSMYLRLYGLDFEYSPGKPVPFCASGIGFVSCMAYRSLTNQETNLKLPDIEIRFRDSLPDVRRDLCYTHPSCQEMVDAAVKKHLWVAASKEAHTRVKPGWLVFYNWQGGDRAQHVGIVEVPPAAGKIQTIEFNTGDENFSNGGAVLRRKRALNSIIGYIDTHKEPK
jgi:hypothetical protein